MKESKTITALVIMILAGVLGFFLGSTLEAGMEGAILFAMISGFTCVVLRDRQSGRMRGNRIV